MKVLNRVLMLGYLKTCIKNHFNCTYSHIKLLRNTDEYAIFQFSVVIMRSLPLKKYQTYELKSENIDYSSLRHRTNPPMRDSCVVL